MNAVPNSGIDLIPVQAEHVLAWWGRVLPFIERVMPHCSGEMTPPLIRQNLVSRDMQLWVGLDGANITHVCITQIVTYQTAQRTVEITHCSGDRMEEWVHDTVETIARWGEAQGCDDVRVIGRKGWGKVLPGFKPLYSVFQRKIR